ncbi:MAG: hypothetical protein ACRDZR_08395 [Acidimicrobiales bacterium]
MDADAGDPTEPETSVVTICNAKHNATPINHADRQDGRDAISSNLETLMMART